MTRSWALLPSPTPKDQVGGHEGIGQVVKLGPGAESSGLKLGSRVGVKWLASICGECGTLRRLCPRPLPARVITPLSR